MHGNANDMSGNNNNGTVTNAIPTTDRFNNPNSAYSFNGTNAYISVPSSTSIANIEGNSELTVSVWLRVTAWYQNWNVFSIVNKYNPIDDYGWEYMLMSPVACPEQVCIPNYPVLPVSCQFSATGTTTFNQWNHYAMTFSRSAGLFKAYKNGVLMGTISSGTLGLENTGNGLLYIGYSPGGPDEYSNGAMDDLRMYNRALTQSEILMLYNSPSCCAVITPTSIIGPTVLCNGSAIYSVTPFVGATSYSWSLPNGWSGSSSTNTISATSGSSGIISVIATNTCGASASSSIFVNVGSPATPPAIAGSSLVCSGAATVYSVAPVQGASSYSWSLPNGWSGSSVTNSISATPSAAGTLTVYAINICGSSSPATLAVNINNPPTAPSGISGNTLICQGLSALYTTNSVPGATSYSWNLPPGWTGNSSGTAISATSGSTGLISVSAVNSCGTSSVVSLMVNVITQPVSPAPIYGNTIVCSGNQLTFSVSPVNGATSYNWSIPNGWLGNSNTNVLSATATGTSGVVYVNATNSCGSSPTASLQVTVSTYPANPGAISGSTLVCIGVNLVFSVAPIPGATSYSWTVSGGLSGSSNTNSISINATGPGSLTVIAANFCGQSTAFSAIQVSIQTAPQAPSPVSGPTLMCASTSSVFSVVPVAGATSYSWSLPGSWSGSSNTNSISVTSGLTPGNITVTAINACGTSSAVQCFVDLMDCVTTNVNELSESEMSVRVYPVPSTDILSIKCESSAELTVQLLNTLGQVIIEQISFVGETKLNVAPLKEGLYFIRISSSNGRIVDQKIIVSH
jgi:hypothetical protein